MHWDYGDSSDCILTRMDRESLPIADPCEDLPIADPWDDMGMSEPASLGSETWAAYFGSPSRPALLDDSPRLPFSVGKSPADHPARSTRSLDRLSRP